MKSGKELTAIFLKQVVAHWPPDFNPVSCPDRRLFVEFLDVCGGSKIGQELAKGLPTKLVFVISALKSILLKDIARCLRDPL